MRQVHGGDHIHVFKSGRRSLKVEGVTGTESGLHKVIICVCLRSVRCVCHLDGTLP